MYPHRIRLRGPWEYEILSGAQPSSGRLTLPCRLQDTGLAGFHGEIRFRRRFGLPRQLDEHERVWLVFQGVVQPMKLSLNGLHLAAVPQTAGFEIEVTNRLQERNVVDVEMENIKPPIGLWEEAALEIRCRAFMRNVQVTTVSENESRRLEAHGLVVGTATDPLDLYLIVNRSNAANATVVPAEPTGTPFHLRSEPMIHPADTIRIELVAGGLIYDCFETVSLSYFGITTSK
jgi:hypothetical protein